MKRAIYITLTILLCIAATIGGCIALLNSERIQTAIVRMITEELSHDLGTQISIGKVDYDIPNHALIDSIYIEDQQGDTLLYVDHVIADFRLFDFFKHKISFSRVELQNTTLAISKTNERMNYEFLVDYFTKPQADKEPSSLVMEIKDVWLNGARLSYQDNDSLLRRDDGIDMTGLFDAANIRIDTLNLSCALNHFDADSLNAEIRHLYLHEQSGLQVEDIEAQLVITPKEAYMPKLRLQMPNSHLTASVVRTSLPEEGLTRETMGNLHTDFRLDDATIVMRDIAPLAPSIGKIDQPLTLSAHLHGRVDSLNINDLMLSYDGQPIISGDIMSEGLPDVNNTFFSAQMQDLHVSKNILQAFLTDMNDKRTLAPDILGRLGDVHYHGVLQGRVDSIDLQGSLLTNLGVVNTNGLMKSKRVIEAANDTAATDSLSFADLQFNGRISTSRFALGKLLAVPDLGNISMQVDIDGHIAGDEHPLHGKVNAIVREVSYRKYAYRNLKLNGKYSQRGFDGQLNIHDPNLAFDFNGLVDLAANNPTFEFALDMQRLHFDRLNLLPSWTDSDLSLKTNIRLVGASLDEMQGTATVTDLALSNRGEEIKIEEIALKMDNGRSQKGSTTHAVSLKSDIGTANLSGEFAYSTLPMTIKRLLAEQLPSLFSEKDKKQLVAHDNSLTFYAYIKNLDPVFNVLGIDISIPEMLTIKGSLDEQKRQADLRAVVPELKLNKNSMSDITLSVGNSKKNAYASVYLLKHAGRTIGAQRVGALHCQLSTEAHGDSATIALSFDNKAQTGQPDNSGVFETVVHLSRPADNPLISAHINPSTITLNDSVWSIGKSDIEFNTAETRLRVSDMNVSTGTQTIKVEGVASKKATDSLFVSLDNLNLDYLLQYTDVDGVISFGGELKGWATIYSVFSNPMFEADASMLRAHINNSLLGDAHATAVLDKEKKEIVIDGAVVENQNTVAKVDGEVKLADGFWKIDIDCDSANLAFINFWTQDILEDITGRGYGRVSVFGKDRETYVVGRPWAKNAELGISYLGTRYHFTDTVVLDTTAIYFHNITLYDRNENPILLDGAVHHTRFEDFTYDISIDVDNALAMNLKPTSEDMFYGMVSATGKVHINGNERLCQIDVDAATRKTTDFFLSLTTASNAKDDSFVEFTQKEENKVQVIAKKKRKQAEQEGATRILLTIQAEVTPDADIALFISKSGDQIRGKGNGNLKISYDSSSDVRIYGDLELLTGTFDLTIQDIVHRSFNISSGSKVFFNGDAENPQIDASAYYSTTASLRDLFGSDYSSVATSRTSVPVNCILYLTGNLSNPTISFGIELPQSDESVASQVRSVINTDEMLMREIIYLLVFNRFYTPDYMKTNTSTVGLNETYSLLSSTITGQINNWLSKITNNFTIGFNIRTDGEGADASQEYETQFQIQPTSRLLINGNVGYRYNDISNQPVFGNVDIEYMLTPDGQLRAKAYTHTVDKYSLRSATTVQGVGLKYQHDFNIGDSKKKKAQREKEKVQREKEKAQKKEKREKEKQEKAKQKN